MTVIITHGFRNTLLKIYNIRKERKSKEKPHREKILRVGSQRLTLILQIIR